MLIIFGSFYMSNSKGTMEYGLTLSHFDNITLFICKYLLFIVLKFLLFYIIIKKQLSKNVYFYISLVELIVIPLFYIRDKNLIMRGSIPALYLLMIMIMQFYSLTSSDKKYILNKKILSVLLIISSVAALSQFSFSVYRKMTSKNYVNISLISFTHLDRCQDYYKELIANNFFAYDYKNKFFFKYLAK